MAYSIIHLGDMIDTLGEEECKRLFANFSCPIDSDIELFLKDKAILFQKMAISRTYLIYTSYKDEQVLVGYFAIASKVLNIRKSVSTSLRKKITGSKSREINEIPVFLLGQLSKNYANGFDKLGLIKGDDLLRLAFQKIIEAQHLTGGRSILVECSDQEDLKEFYTRHGFSFIDKDGTDGLLRYIREINGIKIQ